MSKKTKVVQDPVITKIRAAWMAAHAPQAEISAGLEDERWIARCAGIAEISTAQIAKLESCGLRVVSQTTDGVERKVIVMPVGTLAAVLSLMTAAEPEPIPNVVIAALANAIEANADVSDREAMIGYVKALPSSVMALDWIREEHGRYDDAVQAARAEAEKRREIRFAKTLVQVMPAIEEPPIAPDDTTPLSTDEQDAAQNRSRIEALTRELDAAKEEIARYQEGAARQQRVISEQNAEILTLKATNERQSDMLKQAVNAAASVQADDIAVFVSSNGAGVTEAKEVTALRNSGEWIVASRAVTQTDAGMKLVYFMERKAAQPVGRHGKITPIEAFKPERSTLAADQLRADFYNGLEQEARERMKAVQPVQPVTFPDLTFGDEEVA